MHQPISEDESFLPIFLAREDYAVSAAALAVGTGPAGFSDIALDLTLIAGLTCNSRANSLYARSCREWHTAVMVVRCVAGQKLFGQCSSVGRQ
jgi:hypothetical protein